MVESDVSIRKLVKRFGDMVAVDGIDLEVPRGAFVTFLGPSGCGKTTTLRMIGGFEHPDSGEIFLKGEPMGNRPPHKRDTSMVFQNYALFPHMSVADNIAFGLREHKVPKDKIRSRVQEMLELIELPDRGKRKPSQLSGGQQQRVALARALADAPPLVLLDEPFSNLDAAMRIETRQEVRAMLKQAGSSAILVTHDQEEALAMSDRIAVMEGGRIRQVGTPAQIYREPVSEFVASFIGRSNILRAQASGGSVETMFGNLVLAREAAGDVAIAIRPEQITLMPDPAGAGTVVGREFRGHDQLYWVRASGRTVLVIAGPVPIIDTGTRVRLEVCDCVVPLSG